MASALVLQKTGMQCHDAVANPERIDKTRRVPIRFSDDIIPLRALVRSVAEELGFAPCVRTMILAAVSEIARNIVEHAGGLGELAISVVRRYNVCGLRITATDRGPGIPDPERAMQYGWSTTHSLGLGLPAARRAMDEFELRSAPGDGTSVTMTKWKTAA